MRNFREISPLFLETFFKTYLMFGAPHFPNSAFAETGPRVQCAAGFPHWEFSSVSALCMLQGAGPNLLPMVVLAGSWVRRSQLTQYYNQLIRERFIHIMRTYITSPSASPGTALHRRGLVLASNFFVVFYPEFFSCAMSRIPSRANTSACALAPREHMFSCAGPQPFRALFPFFVEDFSACAAFESTPVASGLRPSASRVRFLLVGSPVAAV